MYRDKSPSERKKILVTNKEQPQAIKKPYMVFVPILSLSLQTEKGCNVIFVGKNSFIVGEETKRDGIKSRETKQGWL